MMAVGCGRRFTGLVSPVGTAHNSPVIHHRVCKNAKTFSPVGTADSSPAIHRRDRLSPVGTAERSAPNEIWIVLHAVLTQECEKLLLESDPLVVRLLFLNVCDRFANLGHSHGERAVPALPGKMAAV